LAKTDSVCGIIKQGTWGEEKYLMFRHVLLSSG